MTELVLGSASPRRAELLEQAGFAFVRHPVVLDETPRHHEKGPALVERLARSKARACLRECEDSVVVTADTVVTRGERIYRKPVDFAEYAANLRDLSDTTHEVVSGVCVASATGRRLFHCVTRVCFGVVSEDWIDAYWGTDEPRDKAGGYAIQGRAAALVRELHGSYTNVIGLPLYETCAVLAEFDIHPSFAGSGS